MTPIMPPEHSLSLTRIMDPPQAISILCQVSWQVPYLGCRSDFNNGFRGESNSGPILASFCLFVSKNGPSLGHLNLVSDGATSVHVSYLWFPGRCHVQPRAADLTLIMASEVTRIVVPFPRCLFESDSNNGPFPGHLNVRWSYICSCLLPMVSWQVPYLAKGCRPDFNNGFRSDSNSGSILAPSVYSSLTQIMATSQAIPILNCNHELAQSYFKPALDAHNC